MNLYHRKLYVFLRSIESIDWLGADVSYIYEELACLQDYLLQLRNWWDKQGGNIAAKISSSSDRLNLNPTDTTRKKSDIEVRHPISGQKQHIAASVFDRDPKTSDRPINIPTEIAAEKDVQKVFWWFWRYFPQLLEERDNTNALLIPTHRILPDCPLHSYQSTVSALTGAIFHSSEEPSKPYLFLFTFSPVQEFIKAARKFLDFWAGSYLLHYFSALLCFEIAKIYGPDAIITPSLWNQEIIDAFILQDKSLIISTLEKQYNNPAENFHNNPQAQSLSTAGFPNVITVLLPNQEEVGILGKKLDEILKKCWLEMSQKVRKAIKERVKSKLENEDEFKKILGQIAQDFPNYTLEQLTKELNQFKQPGCWEWNKLWDAQINNTWETYYVGVPFGHPEEELEISIPTSNQKDWIDSQTQIAKPTQDIPNQAELAAFSKLNVGSLWGSLQARLGNAIQAVKNTRAWQIPVAPGERSTLSGQYSAVHPRFIYQEQFQNGLGMSSESLRLFWNLMGIVFPGLFNGSEKLNAIELTKRMAWKHGGVAASLGLSKKNETDESNQNNNNDDDDYEGLIRFPNLSSIAAAHFTTHNPEKVEEYWNDLRREVYKTLRFKHDIFCSRTRRPFQVKRADQALVANTNYENGFNGVMFSSKWLADDMSLTSPEEKNELRRIIDGLEKQHFGDNNPADWWVLVLGDGDGMGGYVNGRKLHYYQDYIVEDLVNKQGISNAVWGDLLEKTKKRMGPATHVGLNRALLDFSNRIVPYITEQRCCGRVIYSGGDDVMAALSLADLPKFLLSLRAAWSGETDPENEFNSNGGYWQWNTENPNQKPRPNDIPARPLFTMGKEATMSLGIVVAHKSVPLPTVLEKIWDAEKERAKKMIGGITSENNKIPEKDGLCFRVIYGSGNTLEAFMKGHLLEGWWDFIKASQELENLDLSPILYRLAEELPRHADITEGDGLFRKVAEIVLHNRDVEIPQVIENQILGWLENWEKWAWAATESAKTREKDSNGKDKVKALGASPEDMAMLLKFTAFWTSRIRQ
jgi:CRISPR-associated protein Cmr2